MRATFSPFHQFSSYFLRDFCGLMHSPAGESFCVWIPQVHSLCEQLGWVVSVMLSSQGQFCHPNMVTPHLYANRIQCLLLQLLKKTILLLFFFSSWYSQQNIHQGNQLCFIVTAWMPTFFPLTTLFPISDHSMQTYTYVLISQRNKEAAELKFANKSWNLLQYRFY